MLDRLERAMVVRAFTARQDGEVDEFQGTGFLVSPLGYISTCAHVPLEHLQDRPYRYPTSLSVSFKD